MAKDKSKYLRSVPSEQSTEPVKVDRENGIIFGVSLITAGPANGHKVQLDQPFIEDVVRQGSEFKKGMKARYGHPNMCSTALGTYIGRYKNFRVEANRSLADLHLDKVSAKSPNGNLYEYVLSMAESNPDMFGASIAFEPGKKYKKDPNGVKVFSESSAYGSIKGDPFIELKELKAADVVDDPAANPDGLLSSVSTNLTAEKVTDFLNANPEVFQLLDSNPELIEPFMDKYIQYKSKKENKSLSTKVLSFLGFSKEENQSIDMKKFTAVPTKDGKNIRIENEDGTPKEGDSVFITNEDGEEVPATDGSYEGEDGNTYVVSEGKISEIKETTAVEEEEEEELAEEETVEQLSTRIGSLEKLFNSALAENKQLKEQLKKFESPAGEEAVTPPTVTVEGNQQLSSASQGGMNFIKRINGTK